MSENALQRTIRRGVALLTIPLFVLVIQFDIHLRYRANLVDSTVVNTTRTGSYVVVTAATLYLLGSAIVELYSVTR